jgi:hypothetical protein
MTTSSITRRKALVAATTATAAATLAATPAAAEFQPAMERALVALRDARRHLNNADRDKGGHRARAVALVNEAIDAVEAGIRFDNRN